MRNQKDAPEITSTAADIEIRALLLTQLNHTLAHLIETCRNMAYPDAKVYEGWSAKDVLGHITFWHESFARNVNALVNGEAPVPLRGKYADLNERSVQETKDLSTEQIIERLSAAHRIIQQHIFSPTLMCIPYRIGSRSYTPEEHLEIVDKHILVHLRSIKKAQRAAAAV